MRLEAFAIKERDKDFRIANSVMFREECNKLSPGRYRITIEKKRNNKSLQQLGYLYGCVYPLSRKLLLDAGWELPTIEEVDVFWKSRFADQEIVNRHTGEIMIVPGLKRNFTTTDMMAYIDSIRNYCSEFLNGYIPSPEEQTEMEFDNAKTR